MAQRNYLISTTGISTTASGTTIGSGNTQDAAFVVARTLVRTGIGAGGFLSGSQTWAVHYVVSAMSTPYNMRLKVQRRNSSGVMQAESGYGTTRSATGTYDDNLTADLGTWAANDQLALVWEHFRPSGSGNKNATIDANGASYIDAPQNDPNITLALTGVSATGSVGTLGPSISKALTGNQITGTVGALTPRLENIKVRDEFVDTDGVNATSHTVDVGGPWSAHPASVASAFIASNRLTKDSQNGQALLIASATVSGDGYVEAPLRMLSSISVNAGVAISVHATDDDYVYARHNRDTNEYSIRSTVPGSTTVLGTATETLSAGDERVMRLERRTVAGPHDEYRLLVGGVQVIGWTQSDGHTGTRVGVRLSGAASSTTGYALERFEAGEYIVPSPDGSAALTGVSATATAGSVTPQGGLPAIRVFQGNVQHGTGTDGVPDYARQIAYMANGFDIVCMQERTTGDNGWNAGMNAAGYSEIVYRENDPSQGDGPSIWIKTSRVTVIGTPYQHDLSEGAATAWSGFINVDKAAVGARVTVAGISFYVFCTHLAWSKGADSDGSTFSTIREAQLNELMSWIAGIVGSDPNVLIVGDMNFGPDYPKHSGGLQIDLILDAGYSDLWVQGIAESKATAPWNDRDGTGGADMPITSLTTRTHDTRRIDYYFLRDNAQMLLSAISLPDLRANCSGSLTGSPLRCPDVATDQLTGTEDDYGVKPSDHNFMDLTLALTSDVTVNLSGVSATGSVGSLGVSRAKALSGVEATAAIGSMVPSFAVPLNGVAGTSAVNSLNVTTTVPITGVEGTGAVGGLTAESDTSAQEALTGVAATGEVGTVTPSTDRAISGVQSTGEAGSVGVSVTVALTGVEGTGQAGSLTPSTEKAVSGNEATAQVGSVGVVTAIPLSGVEAAGAVGSVVAESDTSITLQLSGVSATGQAGSLSPSREVSLSGVEGVSELGELGLSKGGSASLTGVQAEAQAGSLTPGISVLLTGNEASTSIGNVTPSRSLALSGVTASSAAGTLSVSVDIGLTGVQGNSAVGSFGLGGEKVRTLSGQSRVTIADTGIGQFGVVGGKSSVKVKNGR